MLSPSKNIMHVLKVVLAVAPATLFGVMAFGQGAATTPAAGPPKIGIVSIQEAILSTNEGKKEADVLQQRFSAKQNELKTQDDELQKLKTDLQVKGDKLNEDQRNAQIKVVSDKQKVFQRNYDDYQSEVQQAEQEVLSRLGKKMMDVLDKYAKDNGFTLIMDVSNPQQQSVLWASPATVITKQLVDAYNAASPVAAPAVRPAAAGSTGTKKPR